MRKPLLLSLSVFAVGAMITFQSNSSGPASNGNQATDAPGSGTACFSCHSGGSFGTMSLDLELRTDTGTTVSEYVPGYVYEVAVSVNHTSGTPAGFGAQVVPLASSNDSLAGVFSDQSSNAKLSSTSNGRVYLEHKAISTSNEFTADWRAPEIGTGDVVFYMGGNAVNGNGTTNGDNATTESVTIPEFIPDSVNGVRDLSSQELKLFPNPVMDILWINTSAKQVNVFNHTGSLVKSAELNNQQVDLSDLPNGVYYISVEQKIRKVLKM